jgi:hypothetical protein
MAFELKNYNSDIYRLACYSRDCKCSDPRDRIYAFLGLADQKLSIKPDYTKTTREVYQLFVLRFLDCYQSLNILCSGELQESPGDMPSWVPDWSVPMKLSVLEKYVEFGKPFSKAHNAGDGILKASGVRCATIERLDQITVHDSNLLVIPALQSLTPSDVLEISSSYEGGGTLFDAYCEAFWTGTYAERYLHPRADFPYILAAREAFRDLLRHNLDSSPEYTWGSADVPMSS